MRSKNLKLKNLKLKNFAEFTDFECEFNNKITRLIGANGSGKTTVGLTAIWAGFKGIAEKSSDGQLIGERFRFIGKAGKSTDIIITLIDEDNNAEIKLKRHITKTANQITFEAPKGYALDDQWLKNLLNMSFLSARHFMQLSGKAQALALGIDTSKHDIDIDYIKIEAKDVRKEIKRLGEPIEVEQVEAVSISELIEEQKKINNHNREQEKIKEQIGSTNATINDLRRQQKEITEEIKELEKTLSQATPPEPMLDTEEINDKIMNADAVNAKALKYSEYITTKNDRYALQQKLNDATNKQEKAEQARLNYIKSFNFDLDGLSVDDKGRLLLHDKPLKEPYFSRGEFEIIVAELFASSNPDLKVRFIDDFESLDANNQKKLVDNLIEKGFQIITAEVGDEHKNNAILLRECKKQEPPTL